MKVNDKTIELIKGIVNDKFEGDYNKCVESNRSKIHHSGIFGIIYLIIGGFVLTTVAVLPTLLTVFGTISIIKGYFHYRIIQYVEKVYEI